MHAEGPVLAGMELPASSGDALTFALLMPLSAALTLVFAHTAHSETSTMAAMAMLIKLRLRFIIK
jgi:hypothetical protein